MSLTSEERKEVKEVLKKPIKENEGKKLFKYFGRAAERAGRFAKKQIKQRLAEEKELWKYRRVARIAARKQALKQQFSQKYLPKKAMQQSMRSIPAQQINRRPILFETRTEERIIEERPVQRRILF